MWSRLLCCSLTVAVVFGCGTEPADADDTFLAPDNGVVWDLGSSDLPDPGQASLDEVSPKPVDLIICDKPEDCPSGICTDSANGKICAPPCVENCPDGFQCKDVPKGSDVITVCMPRFAYLCDPCTQDADCGGGNVCLDRGDAGSFCGAQCGEGLPCPSGYSCQTSSHPKSGLAVAQCVPTSGECSCSPAATAKAALTNCLKHNPFGKCPGTRMCTKAGLQSCSAVEAAPEACNGKDDDCDGVIDEGVPLGASCTRSNDEGTCLGKIIDCTGGKETCSASIPAKETCNGLDDDCDGKTDEDLCPDDSDPCSLVACDPVLAACKASKLSGAVCDDGNACTSVDKCLDGKCTGASPLNCDDGNPCTTDGCDVFTGCTHAALVDGSTCDDQNVCTATSKCLAGICSGGVLEACDDQNPCTEDACNALDGCSHLPKEATCTGDNPCSTYACSKGACMGKPVSGIACDDYDACTDVDKCVGGVCVGAKATLCDDGSPCTSDSCDKVGGCISLPQSGTCTDDGNACTVDLCAGGKCTHQAVSDGVPCASDGQPCTDDACSGGKCLHVPLSGSSCDDGDVCTQTDKCVTGQCKGAGAKVCQDGLPCTEDSCDPAAGCVFLPKAGTCSDDGNPCTQDTCSEGKCAHPMASDGSNCPEDGNPCTLDVCASGVCVAKPLTVACDDGNACTSIDKCQSGKCTGGSATACDDFVACTADACDPVKGCIFQPLGAATKCDEDSDPCTLDVCQDGTCKHPAGNDNAPCLDDGNPCTSDVCSAGKCSNKPLTGSPCSDGDACTQVDQCLGGSCVGKVALVCDDFDGCTADTCDSGTGCKHAALTGVSCADDGNECTTDACKAGTCGHEPVPEGTKCTDDGTVCTTDKCSAGSCSHPAKAGACDDGNACTTSDSCVDGKCKGSGGPDCDDGLPCTVDSCSPSAGCAHVKSNSGPCQDDGTVCTSDVCQSGVCQHPAANEGGACPDDGVLCTKDACEGGTCGHTGTTGTACNDGDPCTTTDACAAGSCKGSGKLDCDDANPCTADGCDKTKGCTHAAVSDGTGCGDDGDGCTKDVCIAGTCKHPFFSVTCQIWDQGLWDETTWQ